MLQRYSEWGECLLKYELYKWYIKYMTTRRKIASTSARSQFADMVNRAAYAGERVIVHRRKKPVAAVVPLSDLDLLERLEDRIDLEDARKRLNEPTIPWSKIKRDLSL
ncbi:MAG: type II toxin-antitoxin system Phd/YefM family antitoxin [Terriglobales bacterium]